MQILAFSDLHGDASTLKLLKKSIANENFDYMLVAGDLTNADLLSPRETIHQVNEIFSIMESFKIPYFYVWGLPNRESMLADLIDVVENPDNYELGGEASVGNEKAYAFHHKFPKRNRMDFPIFIPQNDWEALKDTQLFLDSLNFGKRLKDEPIRLGNFWLTSCLLYTSPSPRDRS